MTKRTTESLIDMLTADVRPVAPSAGQWRLATGLALGGLVTLVVVTVVGWRPDLAIAALAMNFWVKMAYTATICVMGIYWLRQLGRPESEQPRWRWLFVPVLLLALVAFGEAVQAPKGTMPHMVMGASWQICSRNIVVLAVPIYLALLWVMRRFAPGNLTAAGAATGLVSGAAAATIYCLHCTETSMLFVLIWYSLGIAIATAVGALLGPRLLNW
jgi:hypothetical protein